jgi:flagellar protein FlaI
MAKEKEVINNINVYPRIPIDFNPRIPPLQKVKDKTKLDVRYPLISPFTFVHIYWDPKEYELAYDIEEPILNEEEEQYRAEVIAAMRDMVNFEEVVQKDKENLLEYIHQRFKILAIELGLNITYESFNKIYYYLVRDFIGFNETDPLLRDYFVEDIECNGAGTPVYIVHRVYRQC